MNQLILKGTIVEMNLSGQQHIEILKGDGAIMMDMQFAQGVQRYIRGAHPAQARKIGA